MVRRKKETTFLEDLKYNFNTVLLHLLFYSLIILVIFFFMSMYS